MWKIKLKEFPILDINWEQIWSNFQDKDWKELEPEYKFRIQMIDWTIINPEETKCYIQFEDTDWVLRFSPAPSMPKEENPKNADWKDIILTEEEPEDLGWLDLITEDEVRAEEEPEDLGWLDLITEDEVRAEGQIVITDKEILEWVRDRITEDNPFCHQMKSNLNEVINKM